MVLIDKIYPIAKLGEYVLFINPLDISKIGGRNALEVMCIRVDFKRIRISEIIELEKHLKFNPWVETTRDEITILLRILNSKFSDSDILNKIIKPLEKS